MSAAGFLAVSLLLAPLPAAARDVGVDPYYEYRDEVSRGEFQYDDSRDIPWIENETEVLAMPAADDLVQVDIDQMPPGLQLWVDDSRITVDPKDRVIRLWLWVRGDQGAENGSFEGFRCETLEYKVYAYANPRRDPPVTKAKRPVWRPVSQRRNGNYRRELLAEYFCTLQRTLRADEIRQMLTGSYRPETFTH